VAEWPTDAHATSEVRGCSSALGLFHILISQIDEDFSADRVTKNGPCGIACIIISPLMTAVITSKKTPCY